MTLRIGVASIIQESNSFAARPTTLADFEAHGLWLGDDALNRTAGTNTEFAGATLEIVEAGHKSIPLIRAWAMSGGTLTSQAFEALRTRLVDRLLATTLDGLVLCLHGALVSDDEADADGALIATARSILGQSAPIVVTYDLHANLTARAIEDADALIGYHTYPHVDQGDTGRRGARLLIRALEYGGRGAITTAMAKRPLLVQAESQSTGELPMSQFRATADAHTRGSILDISLFPVQPWLDVPELGFGVAVTEAGGRNKATELAEGLAESVWLNRASFTVDLISLDAALGRARENRGSPAGPVLLVHSADSPTAGATADSTNVLAALVRDHQSVRSLAAIVDPEAARLCYRVGPGAQVETAIGATLDPRWSSPVQVKGQVEGRGDTPVVLEGEAWNGQSVSIGRWATLRCGINTTVLISERPVPTFDPSGYRHVGLEPQDFDAVEIRSATLFRAGWRDAFREAHLLDLPGASTPRLGSLPFHHAPRPMYPIDL